MTQEQLEVYRRCTGRAEPPSTPASEGWLVYGRALDIAAMNHWVVVDMKNDWKRVFAFE